MLAALALFIYDPPAEWKPYFVLAVWFATTAVVLLAFILEELRK